MATKAFNTGKFAEKVLALSNYDNYVITELYQNPMNKEKINRGGALIIKNYFEAYMDSRAKQNYAQYHHIYEFDKVGNKNARLFKGTVASNPNGATITFNFTAAKEPNREGYAFPMKAEVMEKNDPVLIKPKRKKHLKYIFKNRWIVSSQSVVMNPGGPMVAGSFEKTFNNFMKTQGQTVLQKFGFFKRIELNLISKRRLVIPRINAGVVSDAIISAKRDAAQISGGVVTYYV